MKTKRITFITAKRYLGLLLSAILFISAVPMARANDIRAAAQTRQMYNLVLFAQFDDTAGYNFMADKVDRIKEMCNSTETNRSLKSYTNLISYGQLRVDSVFPQLENDVITPYVFARGVDEYSDETALALEILSQISIPDNMELDGDGDGIADNIVIVVDGEASGTDDFLWPKAFSIYGASVGNYGAGYVNIQNSDSLFDSTFSGGVGVLCHEFLHSIGYPDLYKLSGGDPVGTWDLMSSASTYLQYPLAYQRAVVSGWLSSTDITAGGSYTLMPASSDSGNRVYLLKTPLSDTEFFAVEFRQKGTQFSDELDVKIYGTGLVIYRVNTEIEGNFRTEENGIYVFRPDETTLGAGEGDILHSYYGGSGAPASIGTTDFSDTFADGALVYSDGTNSGIKISNIILAADSASFDVDFADTTNQRLWKSAGDTSGFEYCSSFDIASDGSSVYLLTSDGGTASLSQLVDGRWVGRGSTLGSGSFGSVNDVRLAVCNGEVYMLYHNTNYNAVLCRLEADGTWNRLFESDSLAQYADICAANNKLFITYTVGTYPYSLSLGEFDPATDSYTELGNSLASNACCLSIACTQSGVPTVAFRDLADSSKPKALVFENETAQVVALGANSCGTVAADAFGNTINIAAAGDLSALFGLNGSNVTALTMPDGTDNNCFTALPLSSKAGSFLVVNTQENSKLTVYQSDGTSWSQAGNELASEIVNNLCTASCAQTLYVGYISSSDTLIIKQLTLEKAALSGDVNLDGTVDIADYTLLNLYIHGKSVLNAEQYSNAAICKEAFVSSADLAALKKLIVG